MSIFNNQGPVVSARTIYGDVFCSYVSNKSSADPIPDDTNFRVEKLEINFTGRIDELGDLAHLSTSTDEEIVVVSGMGGVGKTQLARKFIKDCRTNYGNVIWIDSETEENINNAFKQISEDVLNIRTINTNGKEKSSKSVVEQVLKKLCQRKTLFVYDNVDLNKSMNFVLAVAPPIGKKPHVLITSRLQKWRKGIKVIRLGVWSLRESIEYISKVLGDFHTDKENDKQLLAETLQYFPLALRQATVFISIQRERGHFQMSKYIDKFKRDTCEMLRSTHFHDDSTSHYSRTTYTTWSVTLNAIEGDKYSGQLAIRILKIIGYFDADDIEREWFSWGLTFGHAQPNDHDEHVKSAVDLLIRYCMIDGRFQQSLIYIHRLVQEVTRLKLRELQEEASVLKDTLQLASNLNGKPAFRLFPFLSHVIPVFLRALVLPDIAKEFASLPVKILRELDEFSEYKQMKQFGDAIIGPLTNILGPNDRVVLKTQFFVAQSCSGNGLLNEALQMNLDVFEKQNTHFGGQDPDTLQTQCQIAHTYHQLGLENVALQWFDDFLEIQMNLSGKDNPIIFKNMLAIADKDKHDSGLQLYQIIFEKQKSCLGELYPDTLKTMYKIAKTYRILENVGLAVQWCDELLNNYRTLRFEKVNQLHFISQTDLIKIGSDLAKLCEDLKKHTEALQLYQELFEIKQILLGNDHPDTLDAKTGVALVHSKLGQHSDALRFYHQIYERCCEKWGNDHVHTLRIKCNIAEEHHQLREHSVALRLYQEIFEEHRNKRGDDDYTLIAKTNIAEQHSKLGQHADALRLNQEIYDKRRDKLGDDNYLTLVAKCNIAFEYGQLGQHSEAIRLYQEVYEKRKNMWGDDDYDTLDAKTCLAEQHSKLGQHADALRLNQEIYDKRRDILGDDNYLTLAANCKIAFEYGQLGQHSEAIRLYQEVYEKRKAMWGDNNLATLHVKSNIADECCMLGRNSEALRLYQEIYKSQQDKWGDDDCNTLRTKSKIDVLNKKVSWIPNIIFKLFGAEK